MPIVLNSGNLNLLEPCGPVQACVGIASPFTFGSEAHHWVTTGILVNVGLLLYSSCKLHLMEGPLCSSQVLVKHGLPMILCNIILHRTWSLRSVKLSV
jgi:hypothetical protein